MEDTGECKSCADLSATLESLRQQLADADESLKAVERALKDVDYRGSYADGVLYLKQQLAAAKFREESLINTAKVNREGLQEQLAATQEELAEITRQKNRMWFELAAAQVAIEEKGERLRFLSTKKNISDVEKPLAIKPDASALKAHDEALIERVASFVQNMDEVNAARIARATRELKSQL